MADHITEQARAKNAALLGQQRTAFLEDLPAVEKQLAKVQARVAKEGPLDEMELLYEMASLGQLIGILQRKAGVLAGLEVSRRDLAEAGTVSSPEDPAQS